MEQNRPSVSEIRQYLKDAGSYDGTMNNNEMYELYEVLEASKCSSQDNKGRRMESTEMNCSTIDDLRKNSILIEDDIVDTSSPNLLETYDFSNDLELEIALNRAKEGTKEFSSESPTNKTVPSDAPNLTSTWNKSINFNNIDTCNPVPYVHKSLHDIEIEPTYSYPFYCRPEILAQNSCDRKRLIGDFHNKLLNDLNYHQKQSIIFAPWGKPIQTNTNFNGSLDRKPEFIDIDDKQIDEEDEVEREIFKSRAGRTTKRKLYIEETQEGSDLNRKAESSNSNSGIRKRPNLSTLKNDEIIKRSKLFAEPTSRAEKLFDEFKKQEVIEIERLQEIEIFENSLNPLSDEENFDGGIAAMVHSDEPFPKRRIEPPSHKRPNAKNKQNGRGGKGGARATTKKQSNSSETDIKYPSLETTSVKNNKIQKGVCPLCNEQFFQDELLNHASTCGDIIKPNFVTTRKRAVQRDTITCEICDEVFVLTTAHEVHVKECMLRIIEK